MVSSGTGHGALVPRLPPPSPPPPPSGSEELKALVEEYRGFGMFSLIRVLSFRGWRCRLLALLSALLVVGQWAGPFGFIAFKIRTMESEHCPGDGGVWARFLIASVALIYTARLSVASLSHTLELPKAFGSFSMPDWWEPYRLLDLVVESLLYDTTIFIFNLFIVFQDRSVDEMIVNVLALEFFTTIDDVFKRALLNYDSSFLDDMLVDSAQEAAATAASSAQAAGDGMHSAVVRFAEGSGPVPDDELDNGTRKSTCASALVQAAAPPLVAVLQGIRLLCLVAGPLFSLFMIAYGPYCLGSPE